VTGTAFHTITDTASSLAQGKVLTAGAGLVTNTASLGASLVTSTAKLGVNTIRNVVTTSTKLVTTTTDSVTDPTLLLAPYLQPYQSMLHDYVVEIRSASSLLTWDDPALTTYLCLLLGASAIALPFVPWKPVARLLGALALGPHMWFIGAKARRATAADAATADLMARYRECGDDAIKMARLVEEEREKRKKATAEADEAAAAAAKKRPLSDYADAMRKVMEASKGQVEVLHGSRVIQYKHPTLPCPARSRFFTP
jgi:hypothetical protein